LAAVPFHFWCPDVFEGAAAEVAGFLSVASKGAALALLGRFVLVLTFQQERAQAMAVTNYLVPILALLAVLTATFGNLAAYAQTNLKRLLAYSTIAHAGYMLMGLATLKSYGAAAVLSYLVVYLFMNLGAFAVVAFLRNKTGSEDLSAFRGLVYRSPVLVVTLAVFLLSLLGIPPLAGFFAKFQVFSALMQAREEYGAGSSLGITMLALFVIGGLNTVISLFYYVKVLKVMILEQPIEAVEGLAVEPVTIPLPSVIYSTLLALMLLVISGAWGPVVDASYHQGVDGFKAKATVGRGQPRGGPQIRPVGGRLGGRPGGPRGGPMGRGNR
jgi:NADH-quinone oxidoreductase subunit N